MILGYTEMGVKWSGSVSNAEITLHYDLKMELIIKRLMNSYLQKVDPPPKKRFGETLL